MDAKELRIGSIIKPWLNKHNGIIKDSIEFIIVDGKDLIDIIYEGSKVEPIQISEEWLLKFGFETFGNKIYNSYHEGFDFEFYYSNSGGCWNFKLDEKELDIKHVHQLQNLYFALTNKELCQITIT